MLAATVIRIYAVTATNHHVDCGFPPSCLNQSQLLIHRTDRLEDNMALQLHSCHHEDHRQAYHSTDLVLPGLEEEMVPCHNHLDLHGLGDCIPHQGSPLGGIFQAHQRDLEASRYDGPALQAVSQALLGLELGAFGCVMARAAEWGEDECVAGVAAFSDV